MRLKYAGPDLKYLQCDGDISRLFKAGILSLEFCIIALIKIAFVNIET